LGWLKQQGAILRLEWVSRKIDDYGIEDYLLRLETPYHKLPEIIHGEAFRKEMERFLPREVQERTLKKNKFYDFLNSEIKSLIRRGQKRLEQKLIFEKQKKPYTDWIYEGFFGSFCIRTIL
jgi:hypothetical protein